MAKLTKAGVPRKKRIYTSMFDEFRPMIEQLCDEGFSYKQVYDQLPDGYAYSSLCSYITVNKIRRGKWTKAVDNRNVCDKCEYCKHFVNGKGRPNKGEDRICTKSWRVLTAGVRHCPRWCELEQGTVK